MQQKHCVKYSYHVVRNVTMMSLAMYKYNVDTILVEHIFYIVSICYINIAQSVARMLRLMLVKGIVGNV